MEDAPIVRPGPIAVRDLLADLTQRRENIVEFHGFARGRNWFWPRATRVRSPCCKDGVLFAQRKVRIVHDLIGVGERAGWMQQRTQVEIRVPGCGLPATRIWHARVPPHLLTPTSAPLVSVCDTQRSNTVEYPDVLFLIATSSLEQHGYGLNRKNLSIQAAAAKHLRNYQKKFKQTVTLLASILNKLVCAAILKHGPQILADPDTAAARPHPDVADALCLLNTC